jgi:ATP-dependent 26S proteasome regulatory subunit
LQTQIDALKQLPPEVAKERQGWLDKMSEANRASNQAAKAGNKDLARQKDNEAEDYSKKGREIRDKYLAGILPQVDQLSAQQKALETGGSSVSVTLTVNEQNSRVINPKSGSEFTVGAAQTPKPPGLKAHNVRVVFESTSTKRDQIQAAIDKSKLARVLQ